MKKQVSSVLRHCMVAGLSIAVFAGVAEAAQQRSGRDCRQDWKAHKAMYRSDGKTRRTFMRECRSGTIKQPASTQGTAKGT
jgi:hypothetical protein